MKSSNSNHKQYARTPLHKSPNGQPPRSPSKDLFPLRQQDRAGVPLREVRGRHRLIGSGIGGDVHHVLFVKKSEQSLSRLQNLLARCGYHITVSSVMEPVQQLIRRCQQPQYRLIVVEVDGDLLHKRQICRVIRHNTLTAMVAVVDDGHIEDIIEGLQQGADMVIKKTIEPREALVRVLAVLRRALHLSTADDESSKRQPSSQLLAEGNAVLDMDCQMLYLNGTPILLTPLEKRLMAYFLQNANRVVPKSELLQRVWGCHEEEEDTHSVEAAIRRLRLKIEADPSEPKKLLTVYRRGYLFLPIEP